MMELPRQAHASDANLSAHTSYRYVIILLYLTSFHNVFCKIKRNTLLPLERQEHSVKQLVLFRFQPVILIIFPNDVYK